MNIKIKNLLLFLFIIEANVLYAPAKQNLKGKTNKQIAKGKKATSSGDNDDELLEAILNSSEHQVAVAKVQEQDLAKQHMNQITDLIHAIQRNNIIFVQNTLKQNPVLVNLPYNDDITGLMLAVGCNHAQIAEIFLNAHANPNVHDRYNWTPLIIAAQKNNFKIVEMLLNARSNVNEQNNAKETALIFAAEHNNFDMVQILLHAGANPNLQRNDGSTALLFAAQNKNLDMAKILLLAGANPNLQRKDGSAALMFAALQNNVAFVRLLLANGADPKLKDNKNWTALKIAKNNRNEEIARILKEALAENLLQKNKKRTLRDFNQKWQINHLKNMQDDHIAKQDMVRQEIEAEEEVERANMYDVAFDDEVRLSAPSPILDWNDGWEPEDFERAQAQLRGQ